MIYSSIIMLENIPNQWVLGAAVSVSQPNAFPSIFLGKILCWPYLTMPTIPSLDSVIRCYKIMKPEGSKWPDWPKKIVSSICFSHLLSTLSNLFFKTSKDGNSLNRVIRYFLILRRFSFFTVIQSYQSEPWKK